MKLKDATFDYLKNIFNDANQNHIEHRDGTLINAKINSCRVLAVQPWPRFDRLEIS